MDVDTSRFGDELILSDQLLADLLSDCDTPSKDIDWTSKNSMFPDDGNLDSFFPESDTTDKAPDDDVGTISLQHLLRETNHLNIRICRQLQFSSYHPMFHTARAFEFITVQNIAVSR